MLPACPVDHFVLCLDQRPAGENGPLTAVVLGQGDADIVVMMGEQGIFHVLTAMLMYAPTTELTSSCLARLAGTSDTAAREAQVSSLIMSFSCTKCGLHQKSRCTPPHAGA